MKMDTHTISKLIVHLHKYFCLDGVPSSQNPTLAIESWINHNKVEREEFSSILQENLKVAFFY